MSTAMILCNAYIRILYSHIICTSMFGKLLQSLHTAEETLEYNTVAIYTVLVLGMQLKAQAYYMHAQPSGLSIGLEHALL